MFRDLKEYQEIAKIYAEKVSKPEDLDERVRGGGVKTSGVPAPKPVTPPQGGAGGGVGNPTNVRGSGARNNRPKPEIKKFPTTAEIRAANPDVQPGTRVNEVGAEGGGKPSSGDLSMFNDKKPKSKYIKRERGKGPGFVRRGTPMAQRAENQEKAKLRAQAMAKARIAAKKKAEMSEGAAAIPMVAGGIGKALGAGAAALGAAGMMMQSKKKQGTKGGQGFGGEKPANAEVKAPKKEKKPRLNIGKRASGRDRNFIQGGGAGGMESVEYDAYDLVLEYLLSTEQAATIEEANYVMTEMDEKTIGSIVKEVKLSLQDK